MVFSGKMQRIKMKNLFKKIKNLRPEVWLILIIVFALFLRMWFFVGIGFNDDSYYLEYADEIYKGNNFIPPEFVHWGIRIGVYLPVVFFWKLLGISEFSTSLFFLLISLGSILITYLIGKELFNKKIGLISAFLLSIFPLDVIYSTQVGPDVPFQFLFILSLFFLINSEKNTNEKKARIYIFLSGLVLGLSYLFKELIPILLFVLAFYIIWNDKLNKRELICIFKKESLIKYGFFILGFFLIFFLQNLYFYSITEEMFYGEKVRQYAFTHDLNSNSDLWMYPLYMLNMDKGRFEWVHSKPLFGFMYYFVILSVIYHLFKRKLKSILFPIIWLLVIFLFLEYGLHFICTEIFDYCLHPRHNRFLIPLSIPAVIIISRFLNFDKTFFKKAVSIIGIIFLFSTSIYYIRQSHIFLRNGMGYVRETVNYLETLPPKPIYVPDSWTISKFKFFSKYDEDFVNSLKVYADYENEFSIHDAYVVVELNPYTYINKYNYPDFMLHPPKNWILMKNITSQTIGIFSKFNPKIYYVP